VAQTATTLANVLKEAWSDDVIQKQYFADDGPLTRIESATDAVQMGRQVQVPIWSDLNSGGYTSTSAAGGVLNTATNQATNQALFTLSQHFFPIALEFSALNQSQNSIQSVVSGKNLEVEGAIATLRNQATRQLVTNGDGIVAGVRRDATSATVPLVASPSGTNYGYDAIVRDWLRPGAVVDIGTTADTDALVTAATVSAVAESASAPTITIGSRSRRSRARTSCTSRTRTRDGREPGAQRPAQHRQHDGGARRPEPGDRRPGVLAGGVP
jgi:hypothetical protein